MIVLLQQTVLRLEGVIAALKFYKARSERDICCKLQNVDILLLIC